MKKKVLIIAAALLLCAAVVAGYFLLTEPGSVKAPPAPEPAQTAQYTETEVQPTPEIPKEFDKTRYSLTDPTSLWVVVNKKRPLPADYVPSGLVSVGGGQMTKESADALSQLLAAAKNQNLPMSVLSGYRSYATQQITYAGWVSRDGQAAADTYSARAGYSEHQTGLAVDLGNGTCDLEICFANTPAGGWLAANAHTFGFIIRYPNGKTAITGYQYEPWHLRYVGLDLAKELQAKNQTMEEFFELGPAPGY